MLEAMASGLPVITSRTTGGAELIAENEGFLMDSPDDLDRLVAVFREMLVDPACLSEKAVRARRHAQELGWDAMGRKYLDLLGIAIRPGA
jgi:glycosyltransferase involved in cell wall biosynthesis